MTCRSPTLAPCRARNRLVDCVELVDNAGKKRSYQLSDPEIFTRKKLEVQVTNKYIVYQVSTHYMSHSLSPY